MPKIVVPLTDTRIRTVKATDKPIKLSDGGGMYLLVDLQGNKTWRLDYTRPIIKKRNTITLGSYPQVSLAEARQQRDRIKKELSEGIDPSTEKKRIAKKNLEEHLNTFHAIAEDWLSRQNYSEATLEKANRLLKYAYMGLGDKPISAITPRDILAICRQLEEKGTFETAREVKIKCGQVMRYGVAIGVCERDMTQDLKGALQATSVKHRAAITEPTDFAQLLNDIDHYNGNITTQYALKIAPLVFVRPGELRTARWADIDFNERLWRFTPPKTKKQTGLDHIVPLSDQAYDLFFKLKDFTDYSEFVFPAIHTKLKTMSENTINQAIRRLGYSSEQMCGHGFRAAARTILEEILEYPIEIIEQQLAHQVRDMHGRAYNRTKHLVKRREMMQGWADYLDRLKDR
jgi:integrase